MSRSEWREFQIVNGILWPVAAVAMCLINLLSGHGSTKAAILGGMFGQANIILYSTIVMQSITGLRDPIKLLLALCLKLILFVAAIIFLSSKSLEITLSALFGFLTILPAAMIIALRKPK